MVHIIYVYSTPWRALGQLYRHGDIGEVGNGAHHLRVLDALEGSSDNITVMVILVK